MYFTFLMPIKRNKIKERQFYIVLYQSLRKFNLTKQFVKSNYCFPLITIDK